MCSCFSYSLLYAHEFQVSKSTAHPTACPDDGSFLPLGVSVSPAYSGSYGGDPSQSQQSKPYLMCTATDAASAIMDFSKQKVDDGVVDSPPERRVGIISVASPSPLKRNFSVGARTNCTIPRKLYGDDVVDLISTKKDVPNSSDRRQPPAKQRRYSASRSEGGMNVVAQPIRSKGYLTQSVGFYPRLQSTGPSKNRGKVGRSPSGSTQSVGQDWYFKPYSRRNEIMIGYAQLKAQEALRLKVLGID